MLTYFSSENNCVWNVNKMDSKGDIYKIGYFDVEKFRCKEQRSLKPSKTCGLRTKFKALQQYLTFVKFTQETW